MPGGDLRDAVLDATVARFQHAVLQRAFGNYTKSYELHRRVSNIEQLFLRALRDRPDPRVLDVGCGDGYHICLFNSIPAVRERVAFTAIDVSRTDLWLARALAGALSYDNIRHVTCAAEELAFPDSCFDIALCSDVIEHLPRPERCLAEMFRVVKPGGMAILTTPNESSWVKALARVVHRGAPRPIEDDQVHISTKGFREWRRLAAEAGFWVTAARRGALLFGGPKYNRHPALFALILLIDRLLDLVPFTQNCSEAISFGLVKPKAS
ncbi:MAG: class I SAM-dependent methyltransferase [candidate division NC10 bacterium]|nr:class I SAM-dependent methyltransferase [candidate division NC10 bacterium]